MQVAGDALALGDGGEREVLFLRGQQLLLGAALLGEEDVAAADDDHHDEDADKVFGQPTWKVAVRHADGEVVALAKHQQASSEKERTSCARDDLKGMNAAA
jgi:hypothetical protein